MIKKLLLMAVPFSLLLAGCVTESDMKAQIDPINQRLAASEKRVSDLEAKVASMDKTQKETDAAIQKTLGKVTEVSRTAPAEGTNATASLVERIDAAAKKTEDAAAKADASAKRSEDAAAKAEGAAERSETAASKSEKIFEHKLKK